MNDLKITDTVIGLHNARSPAFAYNATTRRVFNGLTIVAWIPLVGVIAGIARLIFTAAIYKAENRENKRRSLDKLSTQEKGFYASMMLRGVFETLSLGLFLILPDIIVTIGRNISTASANLRYAYNSPLAAVTGSSRVRY